MKIQLERTLASCPDTLRCAVCSQAFGVRRIRTWLYSNRGLLQGDICPNCLKLDAKQLKLKLQKRAEHLLGQLVTSDSRAVTPQNLALELLEVAQEEVEFPTLFDWMRKKLEIFAQESQELEAARLGLTNCPCGKRSRLQIRFQEDDQ